MACRENEFCRCANCRETLRMMERAKLYSTPAGTRLPHDFRPSHSQPNLCGYCGKRLSEDVHNHPSIHAP